MLKKINTFLGKICRSGFDKEKDIIKQKLIFISNAYSLLVSVTCIVMSAAMVLLTGDFLWAGAVLCVAMMYVLFILLNHIGRHFLARFLVVFMANNALMAMTILFTHDSYLDIYFLIICGITLLVFDYNERKWFYGLMIYLIILLVIESTPLQNYLPAFNLIDTADIPTMNSVLILGVIVFILIQARILVVLNKVREYDIVSTLSSLQSRDEDIEALGVAVTHDLKTPISIVYFYLNLVGRHVEKKYQGDEQLNEFLDTIRVSLNQMEKLILSYLSFTRMSQQSIELSEVDLQKELQQVIKDGLNKKINEDVFIPAKNIHIRSNPVLLATILQNLIENGLKYNKSAIPQVHISFKVEPGKTAIIVTDNGTGIESKFSHELFKPFKRFNTLVDGTGLGLAIARRAAEKLNAKLYCERTGKEGTVFVLEFTQQDQTD